MNQNSLQPKKENLRKAVKWLSERRSFTLEAIEQAAQLFDLSPIDEDFLLRHFRKESDRKTQE
jgi:hypothetical protein